MRFIMWMDHVLSILSPFSFLISTFFKESLVDVTIKISNICKLFNFHPSQKAHTDFLSYLIIHNSFMNKTNQKQQQF